DDVFYDKGRSFLFFPFDEDQSHPFTLLRVSRKPTTCFSSSRTQWSQLSPGRRVPLRKRFFLLPPKATREQSVGGEDVGKGFIFGLGTGNNRTCRPHPLFRCVDRQPKSMGSVLGLKGRSFTNPLPSLSPVELAGCDWIHVDVMDGRFVPNIIIGLLVVDALRPVTDLPLDVHLMIMEPDQRVPDFIKAGADIVSVHCEQSSTIHLHRTVNQVEYYSYS
ncbi:hypothetical protein HID58_047776, partial [Brassica napus]